MANNFHDIIPPERRSIRNITTTHRHPRRSSRRSAEEEHREPPRPPSPPEEKDGKPSFFSRFGIWIIAGVTIVVFVLAFSLLFSGTTVTITPKQRDVRIDGQFTSYQQADVGQLAHEVMVVEESAERTVPATGEETVEERASGRIVIFNNFDESNQRLITNTRFETPDGLIYRIDEPVVVPGQKTNADGDTIPGEIEVVVYADEPGERYNIGLTDFTIPGFKGGPRFDAFIARSRTPMTGGFVGTRLTAAEADIERARSEIRTELERTLRERIRAEAPESFFLFDDAMFLTYESLPQGEAGNEVVVREKATLHAIVYRAEDLARFIATQTVAGYEQEPISLRNSDALTYALAAEETLRPWEGDDVSFVLQGDVTLEWRYDTESLKRDLAGRSKDALPTILSGYPSIQEANVSLRPFWRRTFPNDTEKVTIKRAE